MTQTTLLHPAHTTRDGSHRQPSLRTETNALLRDMAYVLQLTRRVRDEITTPKAEKATASV